MNNIDELINRMSDAPHKFTHLKIFLHRENTIIETEFGGKFLFVSHDSFGLVKLKNLLAEDNYIRLVLEDAFTGQSGILTIDINDKSLQFLMIAWEDVLDIMTQDRMSSVGNKDLLEFDFQ